MERQQPVAAVVLAAGESRRFGSAKQLAELDGRTLLEHVLGLAAAAGLAPIVAVVPAWLNPAGTDSPVSWVPNPAPQFGMSHSLRLGFEALGPEVDAAVILLGDQPTVPHAAITALLAARGERPIVATIADGQLTPPILIERSHFHLVEQPSGDIGLREVLNAHPDWVRTAQLQQPIADVDTPDDLRRLRDAAEREAGDR